MLDAAAVCVLPSNNKSAKKPLKAIKPTNFATADCFTESSLAFDIPVIVTHLNRTKTNGELKTRILYKGSIFKVYSLYKNEDKLKEYARNTAICYLPIY